MRTKGGLMTNELKLDELMSNILSSKRSDFYRKHFEDHSLLSEDLPEELTLHEIPILTWENLKNYPFLKRIYTREHFFTKIVCRNGFSLLLGRTRNDVACESFGEVTDRMSVLFENAHESIEKGLWLYEHDILPHISELNLQNSATTAIAYRIDGLLGETKTLAAFTTFLPGELKESIKHINVVDTLFDIPFLKKEYPRASLSLILALPEVGTIAHACSESYEHSELHFHPDSTNILEFQDSLLVTRLIGLPTPFIRYDTGIKAALVPKQCKCDEQITFRIL